MFRKITRPLCLAVCLCFLLLLNSCGSDIRTLEKNLWREETAAEVAELLASAKIETLSEEKRSRILRNSNPEAEPLYTDNAATLLELIFPNIDPKTIDTLRGRKIAYEKNIPVGVNVVGFLLEQYDTEAADWVLAWLDQYHHTFSADLVLQYLENEDLTEEERQQISSMVHRIIAPAHESDYVNHVQYVMCVIPLLNDLAAVTDPDLPIFPQMPARYSSTDFPYAGEIADLTGRLITIMEIKSLQEDYLPGLSGAIEDLLEAETQYNALLAESVSQETTETTEAATRLAAAQENLEAAQENFQILRNEFQKELTARRQDLPARLTALSFPEGRIPALTETAAAATAFADHFLERTESTEHSTALQDFGQQVKEGAESEKILQHRLFWKEVTLLQDRLALVLNGSAARIGSDGAIVPLPGAAGIQKEAFAEKLKAVNRILALDERDIRLILTEGNGYRVENEALPIAGYIVGTASVRIDMTASGHNNPETREVFLSVAAALTAAFENSLPDAARYGEIRQEIRALYDSVGRRDYAEREIAGSSVSIWPWHPDRNSSPEVIAEIVPAVLL